MSRFKDWVLTFNPTDKINGNRYVVIYGDWKESEDKFMEIFGHPHYEIYEDRESAGVKYRGLTELFI